MPEHILHISSIHISEDQISINKLLAYAAILAYVKQITEQSRRLRVIDFVRREKEERKQKKWKRRSEEEVVTNLSNWRQ